MRLTIVLIALLGLTGCGARNEPPSAQIVEPANSTRLNERTVTFRAQVSDPDDNLESTIWSFGDGQQETAGTEVTHTYAQGGEYTVRVTAADEAGESATAAVRISINQPPQSVARAQIQREAETLPFVKSVSGEAPMEIQFEGSRSSDPDGQIESYVWDFGDGATHDKADPVHTYAEAGRYEAVLTVTDAEGLSDTDHVTVRLAARPVKVTELMESDAEVPDYQLISGYTLSGQASNKRVLYRYRLGGEGPWGEEEIRLALLDALAQLAPQPELSRITLYLFSEQKAGFMDPGDYDHYLGMAEWERPDGVSGTSALMRHVIANASTQLNEDYLDGNAITVVGYELITVDLQTNDPRCGVVCETSNGTLVRLILRPEPEDDDGDAPAPLCREHAQTTIQGVLNRALGAPGGYWLNIYEGSVQSRGLAVGLWAVDVDIERMEYDNPLLLAQPDGWEIDSDALKLSFLRELPGCEE